ncbi:hypothetical protein EC968_006422 [Mortierella alpina]|nr:hypothetical protein EC968_006422 [Mortierella alpina]
MPSQQPPHLLSTPKLGLERERDTLAPSGQDWTLPSTFAAPAATPSPTSASSASGGNSSAAARNRRRSSTIGASSSSSLTTTLPPHLASSLHTSMAAADTDTEAGRSAASLTVRSAPPRFSESRDACQPAPSPLHLDKQKFLERPSSVPSVPQGPPPVPPRLNSMDDVPVMDKAPVRTPLHPRHQRTQSAQTRSRQQSPSVRLALANPTLSKSLSASPSPGRIEFELDQAAHAKDNFEQNVRRYYYQLTIGCQLSSCSNRLCKSCKAAPKMTKDAAAILSVQLAARPRLFFCKNCALDPHLQPLYSLDPATASHTEGSFTPSRRSRMASNTKPAKIITTTSSSRSSPGPGASSDDFMHTRDLLYEPTEYSKSTPSLSAPHILSPGKLAQPSMAYSSAEESQKATYLPLSPPSPTERSGTPLFRSLLSVAPFSTIFSRRTKPSSRPNVARSKDTPCTRASPPELHSHMAMSGPAAAARRMRSEEEGSCRRRGTRARCFSPASMDSPPSSEMPTPPKTEFESSRSSSTRPPLDNEDRSCNMNDLHSSGSIGTIYREKTVGLGLSSGCLHSQKALDLSRYYRASSHSQPGHSIKHRVNQRRKKRDTANEGASRSLQPLFGSRKDPDGDSVYSSSSTDDEHKGGLIHPSGEYSTHEQEQEQQEQELQTHNQHRRQQSSPSNSTAMSTVSPPLSPWEKPLEHRTPYSFTRCSPRRGSSSSLSSIGEFNSQEWLPAHSRKTQGYPTHIGESSSAFSTLSSLNGRGDTGLALPYLNLTLLRQAITTYNSSRPARDSPSQILASFDDIEPISVMYTYSASESEGELVNLPELNGHSKHDQYDKSSLHLLGNSAKIGPAGDISETLVPMALESIKDDRKKDLFVGSTAHADQRTEGYVTLPSRKSHSSEDLSSESEAEGLSTARSRLGSPAHSMSSSSAYSTGGDSTFLVDSLRSVFSSATALGASFLMKDREERMEHGGEPYSPSLDGVNVGGIDLEALRECYEMMIELKPRTIFTIQVTSAVEILLAKMELEQASALGHKQWSEDEMRAIVVLLMNPLLFEQPYQESLLRRILQIFVTLQDTSTMTEWLSCLDEEGMAQLVTLFKMYLSAHFTTRPVGSAHPAICAVKGLDILYQANNIGTEREQERQQRTAIQDAKDGKQTMLMSEMTSTISYKYFYSGVMEALKFRDEYQIWREGWDKSDEDKPFSYFDYPFLLSPTSKSHIINLDALTQMSAHYEDACVRHAMADHAQRLLPDSLSITAREFQKGIRTGSSPYLVLELTRAHLVEEAFEQITKKHADLKKPLKVAFVDVGEEGMDQGGVTKEFFQIMVEKVFDSQFGLFKELEEQRSWWFEGTMDGSSHVEMSEEDARVRLVEYELVGVLVGLALYNGVIFGVRFPSVVYRKLLNWQVGLDTFIESFPALGHGLEQMLTWTDGDVYDVFMREFEISYEHLGQVTTIPLVPGGQDIPVTNANREEYVKAYIEHYVYTHIRQEFEAFQRGFEKICSGPALKLLRPEELELLLCGHSDLDMHDLEASCLYDDGYSANHTLIKEFWQIVHEEMTAEQHKQLLVFVTGSDRVPIRGLKDLMFVIQRNGPDSDRLPTALTCFSRLLLPEYADKAKLKERLVTAIENSHGFGLV